MRTAALYIRVSTDDQTEYSPDAQERLLQEYAQKNNLLVLTPYIFIENGISGKKADKRPQFQKMIAIAKSKEHPFDVILVWKFSRFARNQEESIVYKSLLKKNNIDVISISEPLVDGPFGSLIERIIEWMDEYYSIRLAGEVKRGMTEKAMRGEYQAVAPYGYYLEQGQLIPEDEKAKVVQNIFNLYINQSHSFFSIAQMLNDMGLLTNKGNKFESRTVKYMLQNPVYKGYVRWNPEGKKDLREQKYYSSNFILKKGNHKPLISEELWERANDKLRSEYKPRYSKPSSNLSHWLGGMVFCSNCNSVLVSTGGVHSGFQCNGYSKGKCSISHFLSFKKLEQIVIQTLKDLSDSGDFEYEVSMASSFQQRINTLNKKLEILIRKEDRITKAYLNGVDSLVEYKDNKQKLLEERKQLEKEIYEIEERKNTSSSKEDMIARLKTVYSILMSDADIVTKNKALKSVVEKIIYHKEAERLDIYLFYS